MRLIWGIIDPRINHEARINHVKRRLVWHGFADEAGEASGKGRARPPALALAQQSGGR
jgi:hypothetical protein